MGVRIFVIFICYLNICVFGAFSSNRDNVVENKDFIHTSNLLPVLEKLYQLEKNNQGKVNIVHIGDSHIQADMLTNIIRQELQTRFGNGGYGFTFPYKLANTNGSGYIDYSSNIEWERRRNIYPITDVAVGLSGIGLYTNKSDFEINMTVDPKYAFNRIKILSPAKGSPFQLKSSVEFSKVSSVKTTIKSVNLPKVLKQDKKLKTIAHTVESGQTLYSIANKYNISVERLKLVNNLTSNLIKTGKVLNIPQESEPIEEETSVLEVEQNVVENTNNNTINLVPSPCVGMGYTFESVISNISIVKGANNKVYNLGGIVIENNYPGVVYHTIGVNGAKLSDYNKYPLFFEQLPELSPDLLIISLGTN